MVRIPWRRTGFLGVLENGQAHRVLALAAHVLLEPGDGLHVVVEDLGPGLQDDVDRLGPAVEVGGEHFDRGPGALADGQDALAEVLGAAVGQVVAGDGGDDDVPQAQAMAGLGQSVGLVEGDGLGMPAIDRTEAARAGADVAQDHERGGSPGPAFRAIRASGTFADRLEPELG